ncbi:MAG: hypothetical protein LBM99_04525 [Bacillales bacterium]|jgi:hypothetical protein|nr:hypothetical protein [Bacillales bacterium]
MKNIKRLITKSYNAKMNIEDKREDIFKKVNLNVNTSERKITKLFIPSILSFISSFIFVLIGVIMIVVDHKKINNEYIPNNNQAIEYLKQNTLRYVESPIIQENIVFNNNNVKYNIYCGKAKEYFNYENIVVIEFIDLNIFNQVSISNNSLELTTSISNESIVVLNTLELQINIELILNNGEVVNEDIIFPPISYDLNLYFN